MYKRRIREYIDYVVEKYYPLIHCIEGIARIIREKNIYSNKVYRGYRDLLSTIYYSIDNELVDKVYAVHTLHQMIINTILSIKIGYGGEDIESMCSGESIDYIASHNGLLWWREYRIKYMEKLCRRIYYITKTIDWSISCKVDILSRLYNVFTKKTLAYITGEYYTPEWLVEFIVKRLRDKYNISFNKKLVLDPSCGSGRFLVETFYNKTADGENPSSAYNELIGYDINPIAVLMARARLVLAYNELANDKPSKPYIYIRDFLLGDNNPWRPDIVLTNPPWMKLCELRNTRYYRVVIDIVRKITSRYGSRVPGVSKAVLSSDLSILFLEKILDTINKPGYVGIVLPSNQSYSLDIGYGAGKLLTYTILARHRVRGEAVYVGDAFGHGRKATVFILEVL